MTLTSGINALPVSKPQLKEAIGLGLNSFEFESWFIIAGGV